MLLKVERLHREAIDQANKKSTQTNASGNSKLSLGTKVDVITDSNNPDYYKYDNLIKLPDIEVKNFSKVDLSNASRSDIVKQSKLNDISNGAIDAKDGNSYFVVNNSNNKVIRVNKRGLLHTKNGRLSNERLNAVINAGELLKNAVKVNEISRNGTNSEVYFSKYFQDGKPYIVRFVLNNDDGKNYLSLYSFSIRKGSLSISARANSSPSEVQTSFKQSINDFIEEVNEIESYRNDLPLDAYYKLNKQYVNTPIDLEGHKYSIGQSIRDLIDNDLDGDIETKQKQLDIILKENYAHDDYHTWIRDTDDIKNYAEALRDDEYYDYLDDGFTPDYTAQTSLDALNSGEIKVYSSYPIKMVHGLLHQKWKLLHMLEMLIGFIQKP